MSDAKPFSARDIKDWKAYERVRASGAYNMYDPRARQATGLSDERYSFVMKNFVELKEAADAGKETT